MPTDSPSPAAAVIELEGPVRARLDRDVLGRVDRRVVGDVGLGRPR